MALTDTDRLNRIELNSIGGYSYLPCDRDFSIIKRKLKIFERVYTLHEITEIIITSSINGKFTEDEVCPNDILNFQYWWQPIIKRHVCQKKREEKEFVPKIKSHSESVHLRKGLGVDIGYSATQKSQTSRHLQGYALCLGRVQRIL